MAKSVHDLSHRVVHFVESIAERPPIGRTVEGLVGKLGVVGLVVSHVQEKRLVSMPLDKVNCTPSVLLGEGEQVGGLGYDLLVVKSGAGHEGVVWLALKAALGRVATARGEAYRTGAHVVRVRDAEVVVEAVLGG